MFRLKQLLFFVLLHPMTTIQTNPQCPSNWKKTEDKCFHVKMMRFNFDGARQICAGHNSVLASISSESMAKYMFDRNHIGKLLYIGLWVPSRQEGDPLVNIDGSPVEWLNIGDKDYYYKVPQKWGPCVVAMPWSDGELKILQFPIPCNTVVDGFVCQLINTNQRHDNLTNESSLESGIETRLSKIEEDVAHLKSSVNDLNLKLSQEQQSLHNLDRLVTPSSAVSHTVGAYALVICRLSVASAVIYLSKSL